MTRRATAADQVGALPALRWLYLFAAIGRVVRRVGQVWNEVDSIVIGVIVVLLLILFGVVRVTESVRLVRGT